MSLPIDIPEAEGANSQDAAGVKALGNKADNLTELENDLAASFEQFRLSEGYSSGTPASSRIAAQHFIVRLEKYADTLNRDRYERPDGTVVRKGYGLFSREAHVNKEAFLIHHVNADVIVVDEKTGIPVRAEYVFHGPKANTEVST